MTISRAHCRMYLARRLCAFKSCEAWPFLFAFQASAIDWCRCGHVPSFSLGMEWMHFAVSWAVWKQVLGGWHALREPRVRRISDSQKLEPLCTQASMDNEMSICAAILAFSRVGSASRVLSTCSSSSCVALGAGLHSSFYFGNYSCEWGGDSGNRPPNRFV